MTPAIRYIRRGSMVFLMFLATMMAIGSKESGAGQVELFFTTTGDIRFLRVDESPGQPSPFVYMSELKSGRGSILRVPEGAPAHTAAQRIFDNLQVVDSTLQPPGGFSFDDLGRIYFSLGGYATNDIYRGPKDGSGPLQHLIHYTGGAFLGLSGSNVIYSTGFNDIRQLPNYGIGPSEVLRSGDWVRAVALKNGVLYYQDYWDKKFYRLDLVTRAVTPIFANAPLVEQSLAADDRYVYRFENNSSTNSNIDRTLADGSGTAQNIHLSPEVTRNVVSDNHQVFFATGTGISAFERDSGAPISITAKHPFPNPIMATVSSTYLYWYEWTGAGTNVYRLKLPLVKDPIANAGADQSANEGEFVNLDGGASTSPSGLALSYSWEQTGGPAVALVNSSTISPTFRAPFVATNQVLTFKLSVADPHGNTSVDFVDVAVIQYNDPPVADAGPDGSVKEGAARMLDGTESFDPNGQSIVDFQWGQLSGPAVTLLGSTTATPTFVAPSGALGETLTFALVVSDGTELSEVDTVTISIVENSAPAAVAGSDQTRDEGTEVVLDGTASSDPDLGDTLAFAWVQTGGAPVVIENAGAAVASFRAPAVSGPVALTFELQVTDSDQVNPKTGTDAIVVNIRDSNAPPSCNLAAASINRLWPPDHRTEAVSIGGVVDLDTEYNSVSVTILSVTQDEPLDGLGDGDSSPDATIVDGTSYDSVMIRRERAGSRNGRVYAVNFMATDGFESCNGSVRVSVPRSRNGSEAIDDGQSYSSTAQ